MAHDQYKTLSEKEQNKKNESMLKTDIRIGLNKTKNK